MNDKRVREAMGKVKRRLFVPEEVRKYADEDDSLPIGFNQTISQPTLVALMTELLELKGNERVLEIGTGSGYQAAILSLLAKEVYTIERIPELAKQAKKNLKRAGFSKNIFVIVGDGTLGLPEKAPFDAIIVTAKGNEIPKCLIEQLKDGGRIVIPLAKKMGEEMLIFGRKEGEKLKTENITEVRFVPLIGKYGFKKFLLF